MIRIHLLNNVNYIIHIAEAQASISLPKVRGRLWDRITLGGEIFDGV